MCYWQKESEFGKRVGCFKAPLGPLGLSYNSDGLPCLSFLSRFTSGHVTDRYLPGVNIGDSLFGGYGGNSPLPCSTEHSNYGSNEQIGGNESETRHHHKYSNIQIDSSWPPESPSMSQPTKSFPNNDKAVPHLTSSDKAVTKKESKFCKIFKENSSATNEKAKKLSESGQVILSPASPSSQSSEKLLGDGVFDTSPSGILWNPDVCKNETSPGLSTSLWNSSLIPYLEDNQSSKVEDAGFKQQQTHLSRIWEQDMPSPLVSPVNNDGDLSGCLRSMSGPTMFSDSLPTLFENPFSPTSISELWKPLPLGQAQSETAWVSFVAMFLIVE